MEENKFIQENSKTAKNLLNTDLQELIKKYFKRKHQKSKGFKKSLEDCINRVDDEGFAILPGLVRMQGVNLNYVAKELRNQASVLNKLGYEFRFENILEDLDNIITDNYKVIDTIGESDTEPLALTKEITKFFTQNIITPLIVDLQKSSNLSLLDDNL